MKRRILIKLIAATVALFSIFSLIGCTGKTDSGETESQDGSIAKFAVENNDVSDSDNKDMSSALSRISDRNSIGAIVITESDETTAETTVETTVETTTETTSETTAVPTVTPVPTPTPAPASETTASTTAATTTEATYDPEPVYEPEPTYTEAPETEPVVVAEPEPEPAPETQPETEPPYVAEPEPEPASNVAADGMCYVSRSGECYHRTSDCSNMKNPGYISIEEAEANGRRPCSKCW